MSCEDLARKRPSRQRRAQSRRSTTETTAVAPYCAIKRKSCSFDPQAAREDLREVKVAQAIMHQAREVWLAADASKFNRPAMVQLADLSQIDCLFTDMDPPPPFPALLEGAQVRCEVARAAATPEAGSERRSLRTSPRAPVRKTP